jgi:hypothetical protein
MQLTFASVSLKPNRLWRHDLIGLTVLQDAVLQADHTMA